MEKRISREFWRTIIALVGSMAIFIILWSFVYSVRTAQLVILKGKFNDIQSRIEKIEKFFAAYSQTNISVAYLEKRYQGLRLKFPKKEEEAFRRLSQFARENGVQIISKKSEPKKNFLDKDRNPVKVNGRTCQQINVSMELRASYKNLVNFIEGIRNSSYAYFTLQNLVIKKSSDAEATLNVSMNLVFYGLI